MSADDEELLKRPPPARPYRPGAAVLDLPREGLLGTLALLQRAGPRESGAIWYGDRHADGGGLVRLVVAPRQAMRRGNYEIPADAVAEIVHQLPDGWGPLAQVHSHPGVWVEHSRYDDAMALSQRALSLVFPMYGRYPPTSFPVGVGVHERQDRYWHLLPDDAAARRVRVVGGTAQVVDLR